MPLLCGSVCGVALPLLTLEAWGPGGNKMMGEMTYGPWRLPGVGVILRDNPAQGTGTQQSAMSYARPREGESGLQQIPRYPGGCREGFFVTETLKVTQLA